MSLTQTVFRFFNDDGSESNATPKAGENSNITAPKGENVRLRIQISAVGNPPVETYQFQWWKVGSSTWRKVRLPK